MCGITGIINLNGDPVSPLVLQRMTDTIAHRGPNDEGYWIEDNVGIGHRRLSIIDLSPAGHQPMMSVDNRYVLSFNGEVYNFRQIRAELEAEGVWFRSKTDSEVVLQAFARWGAGALLKFNGMFGLSLWDRQDRTLLLARDRYGIKPLYFGQQDNWFAFGSEQKAIIVVPQFRRSLNKKSLIEYFTFQNIFTNQTLLENVELLPAGQFLTISLYDKKIKRHQYWDYDFREPDHALDKSEYLEELNRLFRQAVNRQLVSDVELGTYLSGGMDSGSITAIASQELPDLKSFTCGFDLSSASGIELAFDERIKAEAMSAKFKTEHYEMVLKAGDMQRCLPKLAWHLEEPRVGQSYPNYYAALLASKFVRVVLSGSGGDELFGGYPWRYYNAVKCNSFENYIDQYYAYWQRLLSSTEKRKLFAPIWSEVRDVCTRDIFRDVLSNYDHAHERPEDFVNNSLYLECKTFLHGLFIVEDKLSMAHGLENRVPFMDNDLVDFSMRCPVRFKLNNFDTTIRINENDIGSKSDRYLYKTNDGKQILRDMMSRYIPQYIIEGKKQGFSAPDASWFKGESIDFVRNKLINNRSPIYEFVCKNTVENLVNQHLEGKKNRRLLIWSFLNMDAYLSAFG